MEDIKLRYKQLVLPSIEYCCSIWYPYQKYLIDKLEIIQHRAARFVLKKPWNRHQRDSITGMLKELNWPSLQERRKQSSLILMYKIVNHLLIVPDRCLPTPSPITRTRAHHRTLRDSFMFNQQLIHTNIHSSLELFFIGTI